MPIFMYFCGLEIFMNQIYNIMKKFFTLLAAIMMVFASFAQSNKYQVVGVDNNTAQDRNSWYGWYVAGGYVHVQPAESEYLIYIPADSLAGDTLTRVRFYHIPSSNITNYTGATIDLETPYVVKVYTGATVDPVNGLDRGTLVSQQTYVPSAAGVQLVDLTQPYIIPAGTGVAIGVYSDYVSICGLCDEDPACENINYALWPDYDDSHYYHYFYTGSGWGHGDGTNMEHDPWNLSVFFQNGTPYARECNWRVDMYSLDTYEDQESIDSMYIDAYTLMDSLYLAPAIWNMGIDTNIADGLFRLYIENSTAEDFYNFLLSEATDNIEVESGHGFIFSNLGGLMAFDQMNTLGLSFPFTVCAEYETYSNDPDLSNNKACVVLTDQPLSGVQNHTGKNLNIYPNPAATSISVENAAGAEISIYNVAGQKVMSIENADANETINISSLSEGVYVVRMVNGNEVATSKLSIVR